MDKSVFAMLTEAYERLVKPIDDMKDTIAKPTDDVLNKITVLVDDLKIYKETTKMNTQFFL